MNKLKKIGEDGGYSIYENPDKEMVEKIKNIPKDDLVLKTIFPFSGQKFRLKEVTDKGKYLMEGEDGDYITITKEEYNEQVREALLVKINTQFDAAELMNKYMLPFFGGYSYNISYCDDLLKDKSEEEKKRLFNMGMYGRWHAFRGFTCHTSVYEKGYASLDRSIMQIIFSHKHCEPNCSIYLDENGNLCNRNYHINFDEEKEYISVEDSVKEFVKTVEELDVEEYQYHNEKWFTDDYVWIILDKKRDKNDKRNVEFELHKIPKGNHFSYFHPGESRDKINMPKTAKTVSKTHLIEYINNVFVNLGELEDPVAGKPYKHTL